MAVRALLQDLDCTGIQLLGSPTIITPTIVSFVNANHQHVNAAGGGQLAESSLSLSDVTTNDVTTGRHGFAPKAPNDTQQVLRGDGAWGTPNHVLLSTVNASNSATVDFTSSINSTYKRYLFMIDGLRCATDIQILLIRISTDGGSTWKSGASDYSWVGERNYNAAGATSGDLADNQIQIQGPGTSSNNYMGNGATEFASLNINVGHPSYGGYVPIWGDGAWFAAGAAIGISHVTFGGLYMTAGAINGIRFLMSSGNITEGTFRLYGVK